jgi:hypothetical protein
MAPEIPASSIQIGQDGSGVIGQTVIGNTVVYLTIIQGLPASAIEAATGSAAIHDSSTPAGTPGEGTAAGPTPAKEGPNPYQGLLAFQPSDGDRFFGRVAEIENLWQRFRALHERAGATRLLMVYGPSGSGKSSLVRAGLVPELARRPPGGRAQARIALLVPGSQPLQALASVLARIATNDPAPVRKTREFAEELALANGAGEFDGLQRIAALLPEADVWPLVVVVDQLEEIYSDLGSAPAVRHAFLANLLRAAADRSGQVAVVVTLRSDYLGATQADPALNRLIQAQGVFVAALSEQGLRDAIRLPAERRDQPLDPATVDLLVEQSLGRDGALPLLQFTLLRIWEGLLRGQPAAETLRWIGGVGGALAGEADRIQASLPEGGQPIARRLFLNLVQLGEGSRDTRRRVVLQEVIAHGEEPAATRRVIERFASPSVRLITRSSDQDGRETLELSHEALIEAWPLLREWLNSSRADLRFQRRLEEAARHWEDAGKPEGSLWRPPDLDILNQFRKEHEADLTNLQLAFAQASLQVEKVLKQQERRRGMFIRTGVLTLSCFSMLAIGSTVLALQKLQETRQAQAKEYVATHRALIDSDPFNSVIYGLAATGPLLSGRYPWEAAEMSDTLAKAVEQLHPVSARLKALPYGDLVGGKFLVTTSNEIIEPTKGGYYSMKNVSTGNVKRVFVPTEQSFVEIVIELKNGDILTRGEDRTYRQTRNRKLIDNQVTPGKDRENITAITQFKNGDILAGSDNGLIKRWRNRKLIQTHGGISSHQKRVKQILEINDNVVALYSGLEGYSFKRFGVNQSETSLEIDHGKYGFIDSAIALENGDIITAHWDGMLRRWSTKELSSIGYPTPSKHDRIAAMLALADNEFLIGGYDGFISHWKADKHLLRNARVRSFQGRITYLAKLRNDKFISLGADGTSRIWSKGLNLKSIKSIPTNQGHVWSLIALRNGDYITGGEDGSLRRWTGNRPTTSNHYVNTGKEKITAITELLNGDLITGTSTGVVRWWRNGRLLQDGLVSPTPTGEWIKEIVEADNGNIFISTLSGSLSRWSLNKELTRLSNHEKTLNGVASMTKLMSGNVILAGKNSRMLNCNGHSNCSLHQKARNYNAPLRMIELSNRDLVRSDWGGLELFPKGELDQKATILASGMGQAYCLSRLSNGEFLSTISHPLGAAGSLILRWKNREPIYDDPILTRSCLVELKSGDLVSAEGNGEIARYSLKDIAGAICRHLLSETKLPSPKDNQSISEARHTCRSLN